MQIKVKKAPYQSPKTFIRAQIRNYVKYYFFKKNAFIKRQSAVKSKVTRTIFMVLKIPILTELFVRVKFLCTL